MPAAICMTIGLAVNITIFIQRYHEAWPMMPMHLGIVGLPAFLAITWLYNYAATGKGDSIRYQRTESLFLQGTILLLALTALFFPKDFYLPFFRSITVWSHLFLLFGILGKSCLIIGGLNAFHYLLCQNQKEPDTSLSSAANWIGYGYGLLTLSMFSGELWCYLGWGTPVVWHDAAITTVLALWLYWTCFLHLHYIGSWSQKRQALFIVAGAFLVLVLGCHPDMGPFRLPLRI